ncbi:MAG: helix-turn-helix domain-containing protein [Clostridia bacterium]|nr:helix-turn-helix domain-containing protein [Clostridia bacterium]
MNYLEIDTSQSDVKWNMTFLHSHAYYEIYFLVSGSRQIFLKDKTYNLEAPGIIVIPPYVMHKTEGEAFERVNVCISPDDLSEYGKKTLDELKCKIIKTSKDDFLEIKKLLDLAIELKDEPHPYAEERFRSVVSYIIISLERLPVSESKDEEEDGSPSLIFSIINYINSHYRTGISLSDLSREFFLSKTALCSKFKTVMRCSINDYILKNKINHAKELLMKTDMSVEAIARDSGFSSANYMGLVFKTKLGCSPLQFKKQNEMREDGDRTSIRKRYTPKSESTKGTKSKEKKNG